MSDIIVSILATPNEVTVLTHYVLCEASFPYEVSIDIVERNNAKIPTFAPNKENVWHWFIEEISQSLVFTVYIIDKRKPDYAGGNIILKRTLRHFSANTWLTYLS